MRFSRPLMVLVLLLLLLVATVGLATAVSDSIGGLAFHPYTTDGSNTTCVPWDEPATGATRNCDPVNLLFLGMDVATVQAALIGQGWSTTSIGTIQKIHFADESVLVEQNVQLANGGLFSRYHIRLWQTPDGTSTLAGVHHESGFLQHTIDADWETAEAFVAGQFCGASLSCTSSDDLNQQLYIQSLDDDKDPARWRTWRNDGAVTILAPSEPPPPPPPPPPQVLLAVVVSTDKPTYTNKESARITVDVSDAQSGSPISGAGVGLVVDSPSGRSWAADGTTNGDGSVTFKYRINTRRTGTGTYTASATAAAAGYEPASDQTSFEVIR